VGRIRNQRWENQATILLRSQFDWNIFYFWPQHTQQPSAGLSIDGSTGLTLSDITIDDSAGASLGHNTDGFDIGSSTSITISGANVVNQDDCLAVNSGTDITFTVGTCSGGHGLSIGSVGGRSDNTVETVTIESSTVTNSANGVRIKTVGGATGSVTGVTYKDITFSGITSYGIVIEQGKYQPFQRHPAAHVQH
jgi:polygalacturonase